MTIILRYLLFLMLTSCLCAASSLVTASNLPPTSSDKEADLLTKVNELEKKMDLRISAEMKIQEEVSVLKSELQTAKVQLAESRMYLAQSLIALTDKTRADIDKQVDAGVKSDHVIRKRSASQSEEDNSHDDVLSSLSLQDLMPILSGRCKDGKDGRDGINGKDGKDGIYGKDGKDGLNGINGKDGKDGRDGLPGPRGDEGSPGSPGSAGSPGLPGSPGLRGLQGRPGNATKGENGIPGQPGNDGEQGAKGSQGHQGAAGTPGSAGTPGATGPTGAPGTPGAHGLQGQPGVRGLSGAPGSPSESSDVGSVYTRWGRTTCDGDTSRLYHGFAAAGGWNNNGGGGVNYQCLHHDPEYNSYSRSGDSSVISGVEYESYTMGLFPSSANNQNVPCARCYTSRSAVVMIPSRRSCNSGWTKEYEGYLMTDYHGHSHPTTYECVDGHPEYLAGLSSSTNGALFYFVVPDCSSTGTTGHCPPYDANKQLTCVVCSK